MKRICWFEVRKIATLFLAVLLTGCESLSYYGQAAKGQLSLLAARQSVSGLLSGSDTSDELRSQLKKAVQILEFAQEHGLPVEDSYSEYVDLKRPYVVWNVFAAEPYSIQLKTHCFPIAGCVGYKGYFKKEAAMAYAAELKAEGFDVFVGGVSAYSTLGWFNDPLLNTFLFRTDERLAAVLFHELAHKVLYIEGETVFNESFATSVEYYLLERWLAEQGRAEVYDRFLTAERRRAEVIDLILETRKELAIVYGDIGAAKTKKPEIISNLKGKYQLLRSQWQQEGQAGNEFAAWMDQDLNNAHLAAIGAYQSQVPGFNSLLEQSDSLSEFFQQVTELSKLDKAQRDARLGTP